MASATSTQQFVVPECYSELTPLGVGAFGRVCRATVAPGAVRPNNAYFGRRTKPFAAVKRVDKEVAYADSYHAKQIFREILLLKQLIHDNVVILLDLFFDPHGHIYIVTEAMTCDLARALAAKQQGGFALLEPHVVYIVYQVLRGLKYIHSAGVIHRDLKPQNILLDDNLTARICDFGLARTCLGEFGAVTGYVTTRWYRAPEVMLNWKHYSFSLDIWSVGCIMAEMMNCVLDRITHIDPKTGTKYYALFPVPGHVEHLAAIFKVLGIPSAYTLQSCIESSVLPFVQSKIQQLTSTPDTAATFSLAKYMDNVDAQAVSLMQSLLAFDKNDRPSSAKALEHPYLAQYHNPDDEPSRNRIVNLDEHVEAEVSYWKNRISEEIGSLAELRDGGPVQLDDSLVDSLLPDLPTGVEVDMFTPQGAEDPFSSMDTDVLGSDLFVDGQDFSFATPAPDFNAEQQRLLGVVEQLELDQQQLTMQQDMALPLQAQQVQDSAAELSARIALYQSQLQRLLAAQAALNQSSAASSSSS